MRVESQVAVPVERAQLIDPGAFRFDTSVAKAVGDIGGVLKELEKRERDLNDIIGRSKANTIQKTAEDEYKAHIETNADTDTWNPALLKSKNKALSQMQGIKMSPEGRRIMNASMDAWGSEFTGSGELVRIRQKSDDALNDSSILFQEAIETGDELQVAEARLDLEKAASQKFSPVEAMDFIGNLEGQSLIFRDLNIAANNPTTENIEAARDTIKEHSADTKDRFFNEQRLRSMMSQKTQARNETTKAVISNQSQGMGQVFSSGGLFEQQVLPELEVTKSQLTERFTNGTLGVSDDQTFDFMLDKINTGTFFDQDDITSAYATGMSSDEYQQVTKLNEENAKLTKEQKEDLSDFGVFVDTRYSDILRTARPIATAASAPDIFGAIHRDKRVMKTSVRKMVKEGLPTEDIYATIETNFISDTDRFYVNFWSTDFGLPEPIKDITQREERFEAVMDLLKSDEKKDIKRLQKTLKFWYK